MTDQTHVAAAWVREKNGSLVSRLFFSDLNVSALQEGIRYSVYKETKQVIDRLPTEDLVVLMRSTYLSNARNLPYEVTEQVRELNSILLNVMVRKISSEVSFRKHYLTDLTQDGYSSAQIPRATNVSSKGDRSLELRPPGF
jgi:hypothetical protein